MKIKLNVQNNYNSNIQYKEETLIYLNNSLIYLFIVALSFISYLYFITRNKRRHKLQQFQNQPELLLPLLA